MVVSLFSPLVPFLMNVPIQKVQKDGYTLKSLDPIPASSTRFSSSASFISFRCIQCTYISNYIHGFSFFSNASIVYRLFNTVSYIKSFHNLFNGCPVFHCMTVPERN